LKIGRFAVSAIVNNNDEIHRLEPGCMWTFIASSLRGTLLEWRSSLSAGCMLNFSPGREDIARRHCSNAGLLKKNKIVAEPGVFLHVFEMSFHFELSCSSRFLFSKNPAL
jgi:hypothetical protein